MKTTLKKAALTATAFLTTAAPALAAPAHTDNSGILVWTFLGFCALIVVAQTMPALLMVIGAVKAIFTKPAKVEAR